MSNPCWDCQKCLGGCNWSRSFEPVPGWEAKKTGAYGGYEISYCPEFVADGERVTPNDIPEADLRRMELEERAELEAMTHGIGLKSSWAMTEEGRSRKRHKR